MNRRKVCCVFGVPVQTDSPPEKSAFFLYVTQRTVTFETGTDLCVLGKLPASQEQGHTGEARSCLPKSGPSVTVRNGGAFLS